MPYYKLHSEKFLFLGKNTICVQEPCNYRCMSMYAVTIDQSFIPYPLLLNCQEQCLSTKTLCDNNGKIDNKSFHLFVIICYISWHILNAYMVVTEQLLCLYVNKPWPKTQNTNFRKKEYIYGYIYMCVCVFIYI